MALLHLRVVSPADLSAEVLVILRDQPGATNLVHLRGVAMEPAGDLIQADVARECVEELVGGLRELGVDERGSISWRAMDTAIGAGMRRAEEDAPGDGADAILWDEVISSTGEDSTLTWTFLSFMVLACLLAAIGVATNSPITIVGAMVVGPEFGPLAAIAVGLRLITFSNGSADVARHLLTSAGIRDSFEQLLSVQDAPAWKPAAADLQAPDLGTLAGQILF